MTIFGYNRQEIIPCQVCWIWAFNCFKSSNNLDERERGEKMKDREGERDSGREEKKKREIEREK